MKASRALLFLLLTAALASPALADGPAIGAPAPTFDLKTLDGKPFSLADASKSNKAVVLMFIATKCPVSNAYNDRMRDIANEYGKKGILFVGINSNNTEPESEVRSHAKEHGFAFTIVKDPGNKVADLYNAQHTPEIFIVGPDGKLIYHGRIDENQQEPAKVASPDLKNALNEILAGQPVAKAETKAFGCSIKRV
ncbi:MAG TPA: thioredoxin family protein [Thermoanaerobaculia bacterium]|jgi:peroxiredoxin|nr:thioredoxin family protein [Thermoanaerobaculia bacterium]